MPTLVDRKETKALQLIVEAKEMTVKYLLGEYGHPSQIINRLNRAIKILEEGADEQVETGS